MTEASTEYVTVAAGGQLFGIPIARVRDVFAPRRLTRVPLAGYEVAGLLNLRGRIVTMLDLRRQLMLKGHDGPPGAMAIGIEHRGESYGLLVDAVGDVLRLPDAGRQPAPFNIDPRLARVAAGVHRLERQLMIEIDVDRLFAANAVAA